MYPLSEIIHIEKTITDIERALKNKFKENESIGLVSGNSYKCYTGMDSISDEKTIELIKHVLEVRVIDLKETLRAMEIDTNS